MKKLISYLAIALMLLSGGVVHAQNYTVLPSPGIGPDSVFYFLDRLGEYIHEFFTFNPEAKAKLQIEFAGERIAEISAIIKKKGIKTKGVDKAKALLLGNVAHAAEIIKKEKADGKDITKLAKDIDDKFDAQEKLLVKTFQDARRKLKEERLALKKSLAEKAGDTALIASIEQQIEDLRHQDDGLKNEKDLIKESLSGEKEKIEDELSDEDKATDEQEKMDEDAREKAEEVEIEGEEAENEKENENEDKNKNEMQEPPELKEEGAEGKANENHENSSNTEKNTGEDQESDQSNI